MFIYKITNKINNKVYIGQSINPINERLKRHFSDAMNNILDTHFARAIRLYGPENFYIEQIDSATNQDELTQKEQYWIQFYNAIEDGYNETDAISKCGGNTYKSKTPKEMEIIKEKIRQTKLGGKNPHSRKIKCKNIETDKEYFFDSMAEAKEFFHQSNHQFISRRCRGEVKNLYEGKWMFAYQEEDYREFSAFPNASRAKRVEVLNLITNEKTICNSCNEADRLCGFRIDYTSTTFLKNKNKPFIKDNFQLTRIK